MKRAFCAILCVMLATLPMQGAVAMQIEVARFAVGITIPSEWNAYGASENGDGYMIDCLDGQIDMRVYGSYDVDVIGMPYYLEMLLDAPGAKLELFDTSNGYIYRLVRDACVQFIHLTEGRSANFYVDYSRNPQWYAENEALVSQTARTLTFTD